MAASTRWSDRAGSGTAARANSCCYCCCCRDSPPTQEHCAGRSSMRARRRVVHPAAAACKGGRQGRQVRAGYRSRCRSCCRSCCGTPVFGAGTGPVEPTWPGKAGRHQPPPRGYVPQVGRHPPQQRCCRWRRRRRVSRATNAGAHACLSRGSKRTGECAAAFFYTVTSCCTAAHVRLIKRVRSVHRLPYVRDQYGVVLCQHAHVHAVVLPYGVHGLAVAHTGPVQVQVRHTRGQQLPPQERFNRRSRSQRWRLLFLVCGSS